MKKFMAAAIVAGMVAGGAISAHAAEFSRVNIHKEDGCPAPRWQIGSAGQFQAHWPGASGGAFVSTDRVHK